MSRMSLADVSYSYGTAYVKGEKGHRRAIAVAMVEVDLGEGRDGHLVRVDAVSEATFRFHAKPLEEWPAAAFSARLIAREQARERLMEILDAMGVDR